jgi:hypothetical protein
MAGLDLAHWWDDPQYQNSRTLRERGAFILSKLMQRDPQRFRQLVRRICRTSTYPPSPAALTAAQWQAILGAMGASLVEVAEVLIRLGLPWV